MDIQIQDKVDTQIQDEKLFDDHNKKPDNKELLKKVMLALIAILVTVFVIVSNCHKKKAVLSNNTISQKIVKKDNSDTVVDSYESQIIENNKLNNNNKDKWSSDNNGKQQAIDPRPQMNSPQSNTANDPVTINNNSTYQQPQQSKYYSQQSQPAIPAVPYEYKAPNEMKMRLSGEYQGIVSHFKETRQNSMWALGESEYKNLTEKQGNLMNPVDKPLKDLYDNAVAVSSILNTKLPAGSRLIATLDQDVCSDHPGAFTATVARPFEIKGYKLICQSSTNMRDRINVTVTKIISPNNKEFSLEGQVQSQYPGLTGKVTNHWAKRMGPALINAAIGGGFLAWSLKGGNQGRIDTRDAIVSGVVEQSVSGVQNEVTRFGGDYPNTVLVKQGTQFEILLTSEATVQ